MQALLIMCIRRTKQAECDAEQTKCVELQRKLERKLLELEQESQCHQDQLLADFDQVYANNNILTIKLNRATSIDYEAERP